MAKKQQDAAGDTGVTDDTTITTSTKPNIDETVFGALTDKDLAAVTSNMTDAEIAAMGDDEEDDDAGADADADADAGNDGDNADADGSDAGDGAGEGEGADEVDAAAADADPAADADAGADADASADELVDADAEYMKDDGPAIPDYKMPEKADEQLASLEQKGVEIAQKFDSGDITAGEFHAQMNANSDAKGRLLSSIDKARTADETRTAHFTRKTVPAFLRAHPEYNAKENPVLYRALDGEVRALQTAAGQKGENHLDPKLLRQAHINVAKAFGRTEATAADGKGKQQQGKAKPKLPSKDGKPTTPPTLARVPADQGEDTDGGKFARLDRLSRTDPTGYEEALQKMTPAEADEYLRFTE